MLHIYMLASSAAWFRNYLQSSTANNVLRDVDFYRCMHNLAGCYVISNGRLGSQIIGHLITFSIHLYNCV